MSRPNSLARLLETVFNGIEEIGFDGTIKCLSRAVKISRSKKNPDAVFVVNLVAENLKITPKEIYAGIGRKNNRIYAIGFCAYYLYYICRHDMESIQYMLDKEELWVLYKYSSLIRGLDPKNPNDIPFFELKKVMDPVVRDYYKKNAKNNKKLKYARKSKAGRADAIRAAV